MYRLLVALSSVLILFIGSALAGEPAATTESASRLRTLLSADEFTRAGLNKLSSAELAALENALADHQMLPAAARRDALVNRKGTRSAPPPKESEFGAEQVVKAPSPDTPNELRTRIEGTLEEFSGRAVFVLENGQVWQQRIPDAVHFGRKLVNPEVVITRGLGGYKMVIVPVDRVVFVKRIQ